MSLLPAWRRHQARRDSPFPGAVENDPVLPKRPGYYREAVRRLETLDATAGFVAFACQRPLSAIGLAFAYHYRTPGVEVGGGHLAWEPRSILPTQLALVLGDMDEQDAAPDCAAIIDLRQAELAVVLHPLLDLTLPFVGHQLEPSLRCIWQLGLKEPRVLWDTRIHERVRFLGKWHRRYLEEDIPRGSPSEIEAGGRLEVVREQALSLAATCDRYGLCFPFAMGDDRLRGEVDLGRPAGEADVAFALASARAAIHLYPRQVLQAARSGALHHLVTLEMPWVATNARMSWTGVRVDPVRQAATLAQARKTQTQLGARLRAHGLVDPGSDAELEYFFARRGLLQDFAVGTRYAFDKEALARVAVQHPVVRLIQHWRRARDIGADKLLRTDLVGSDGRVHPEIRQLGAETGRQSSRWPNLLGASRWLRPVIVPDPGFGIGEADWAQVELGVAGAHFGDEKLVAMFNTGDVYAAMAQLVFASTLSTEDRTCTSAEFKKRYPRLRDQMKVCTLGMLYGLGEAGLAQQLGVPEGAATPILARFRALFPVLFEAKEKEVAFGGLRGYASTVTGLRRYRARDGGCSPWEHNWLGNHPIQGSAADVFKLAGIRLDAHYPRLGARLLVPLHDAYIFEAPLESLREVAALTARVMTETLQEVYPVLHPRVTVNIAAPACWNKDGLTDPMEAWQGEVEAALLALGEN